MSHNTSYPSPTAAQVGDGAGPFYTTQQTRRMAPADDLELSSQLSREMVPNGNGNMNNRQDMPQVQQKPPEPKQVHSNYPEHVFAQQGYQQMNSPHQMVQQDANSNSGFQDSAVRKKAKVSRACDECRRKKIRCEFPSEPPNLEKCSNCTRTGATCQFSRMPQKRGPSKGYIKELADRLQNVEQLVGGPIPQNVAMESDQSSPQGPNDYPRNGEMDHSRKRNHSTSEGLSPQGFGQTQLHNPQDRYPPAGAWGSQDNANHLPQYTSNYYTQASPQNTYNDLGYNHPSHKPQMSLNANLSTNGRPQVTGLNTGTNETRMDEDLIRGDVNFPWKENLIDDYYRTIHPTFPLITYSKDLLRVFLGSVTVPIRDAFLEALYTAVKSSPSSSKPDAQINQDVSILLTGSLSFKTASRGSATDLVYLQTAILMLISIDKSGPPGPYAQASIPWGAWFGLANSIAQNMRLHTNQLKEISPENTSDNSIESISRRAWWSLIILDKWHAAGGATAQQIPDSVAVLEPADLQILGTNFYHFARLSLVLGHLSEIFFSPTTLTISTAVTGTLISRLLTGELERFRESVDTILTSRPILNLAYWHVKLLHKRHNPTSNSEIRDITVVVKNITSILRGNDHAVSPLMFHFVGLSTMTLVELASIKETKEDARSGLQDIQLAIEQNQVLSPLIRDGDYGGWESVILDQVRKGLRSGQANQSGSDLTIDRGGLQHLADLAVGGTEDGASKADRADEEALIERTESCDNIDWTALTRAGYLNVLSEAQA